MRRLKRQLLEVGVPFGRLRVRLGVRRTRAIRSIALVRGHIERRKPS
jgi:hypothetical protein